MGNKLSRPAIKERRMAFLRRKLGLMTRNDRIDRLVSLTVSNDMEKFRRFAARVNFTREELEIYYERLVAIVGEYCTDIPEIEYIDDTTTPEYDVISVSSLSSSSPDSPPPAILVEHVYKDPEVQREFEEFCRLQCDKKKNTRNYAFKLPSKQVTTKTDSIDVQRNKNMQIAAKLKDNTIGNAGAQARDRAAHQPQPMSGGDVKLSSASHSHHGNALKLSVVQSSVKCSNRSSPTKGPSRMLGKINEGLMTRRDGNNKVKPPCRRSVAPPDKCKQKSVAQDKEEPDKVSIAPKTDVKLVSEDKKTGLIRRCINILRRRTESVVSNRQILEVKPATPENTIKNHKTSVTMMKISQNNLRPDRGIVWPSDLEGLSSLNKAYYVEQFLRTELFKQRCKRKEKGGKTWMNGLSKFQLWVIENEGTDAIDAVLDIVPKNRTNAKAKVKCWRGEIPPPPAVC